MQTGLWRREQKEREWMSSVQYKQYESELIQCESELTRYESELTQYESELTQYESELMVCLDDASLVSQEYYVFIL